MKKYYFLIIVALILGLVLTGCSLLSNISQVPATDQSGVTYLTKTVPPIPSANLVGLWHFDGNTLDSSGNGNDGTITEATYVESVNSVFDKALSFDGLNDYLTVPSSPSLQLSSEGTIEFWFNPGTGFGGYDAFILKGAATGTGGATDLDYGVNRHKDGSIKGWISNHSDLDIIYTDTDTWTPGTWYHIAFTWNGNILQIYVNGISDATPIPQTRNAYTSTDPTTMGRIRAHWYNGLLDEVRIWNVALLPNQLGIIYDFGGFLPPVSLGKPFKMGSTIPIKFQLTDVQGAFITDASPSILLPELSSDGTPTGEVIPGDSSGAANDDSIFRYDPYTNQYIFNLSTKDLVAPATYRITVALGDGTTKQVDIGLK